MKKYLIIAASAAAVLAVGCAKNEVTQEQVKTPVGFGVYVPNTLTKAGEPGTITVNGEGGFTSLQTVGFGVFAQYSNGGDYSSTASPNANFMYNQKVHVHTASWTYTPVKYWPNETVNDSHGASNSAANADKLSFFAYAPFVGDTANGNILTAAGSEGITALTANTAATDPKVSYAISTTPNNAVDLLWAVAPSTGVNYTDVHGASVHVDPGMPLKNLTKPNITQTIPFHFRHATSRIALTIVGAFDRIEAGGTLASETKVTVESVTLSFNAHASGDLNLNNTTANIPNWENKSASATTVFTVSGSNLNPIILDQLNAIPQTVTGVTATPVNLFKDAKTFFTVIPDDASTTVTVTISYYVTTEDSAISGGGSRIKNVISKEITFGSGFAAGYSNKIKIILGLTSVKLEASVEAWNELETSIDLPINHVANSFNPVASVTVAAGGTTSAIYTSADGAVTLSGCSPSEANITFNSATKTVSVGASVAPGVYVLTFNAAGDGSIPAVDKSVALTVTPAPAP